MPACAVEDEDRMGTGGLVPRLAQMRVRVPCWPTRAFAMGLGPMVASMSNSWNQTSSGLPSHTPSPTSHSSLMPNA